MTYWLGSIHAIILAILSLVAFCVLGIIYNFDSYSQILMNTIMSAISYIMLFIIQHTQNHDTAALQLKLDELILHINTADNRMIGVESLGEEELARLVERYRRIAEAAQSAPHMAARSPS